MTPELLPPAPPADYLPPIRTWLPPLNPTPGRGRQLRWAVPLAAGGASLVVLTILVGGYAGNLAGSTTGARDVSGNPTLAVRFDQSSLEVWGIDFPASTLVTFHLDGESGPALGSAVTGANGNLPVTALATGSRPLAGAHTVRACWFVRGALKCPVSARFGG